MKSTKKITEKEIRRYPARFEELHELEGFMQTYQAAISISGLQNHPSLGKRELSVLDIAGGISSVVGFLLNEQMIQAPRYVNADSCHRPFEYAEQKFSGSDAKEKLEEIRKSGSISQYEFYEHYFEREMVKRRLTPNMQHIDSPLHELTDKFQPSTFDAAFFLFFRPSWLQGSFINGPCEWERQTIYMPGNALAGLENALSAANAALLLREGGVFIEGGMELGDHEIQQRIRFYQGGNLGLRFKEKIDVELPTKTAAAFLGHDARHDILSHLRHLNEFYEPHRILQENLEGRLEQYARFTAISFVKERTDDATLLRTIDGMKKNYRDWEKEYAIQDQFHG